jgi:hypothetical protein
MVQRGSSVRGRWKKWSSKNRWKCEVGNMVHSDRYLSINQAYYMEILKRLHAVRTKRPDLWPNDWILHHDNAPAYKALTVKQFLAQNTDCWNVTVTLSPWISFEWLLSVSESKISLKDTNIQDSEDIKKCNDGTESCSTTGVPKTFPTVTAYLLH